MPHRRGEIHRGSGAGVQVRVNVTNEREVHPPIRVRKETLVRLRVCIEIAKSICISTNLE
jgi:hypothetical protein